MATSLQCCWFLNHHLWVLLFLVLKHGVVVPCD
ncbi:rCG33056 [Rattus norvegicus]|uniref:RCG33056 n=1 Tax=Rattus norvegicus TaxID=10116 RepID=A6HGE8_RAT|nr:rCG33056 [Rattus norvegicus]